MEHYTQIPSKGIIVSPEALLTYAYIRSYIRKKDTLTCWPSINTICLQAGITEKALAKYIKELEDNSFIKVERDKNKSNRYSNKLLSFR